MVQHSSAEAVEKDAVEEAPAHPETLNFKVTVEFKKAFKGYAVSQGMTMIQLLKEGFELSKQKRNG